MTYIAPGAFAFLTRLVNLTLSDNQLNSLPPALFQNCTALRSLHGNMMHELLFTVVQ